MTVNPLASDAPATKKFRFVAGALCLDFTNSVGGKRGVIAREHLHSYRDLVSWAEQVGIVDEARSKQLLTLAEEQPEEAAKTLQRALSLREAIYQIFDAIIRREAPPPSALDILNSELKIGLPRFQLAAEGAGFTWKWDGRSLALDEVLAPISRSAAELLAAQHVLEHVHSCEGDKCGWLFVDSTKNHSRRWCDMGDCGNRAKVRRHRLKQKHEPGGEN